VAERIETSFQAYNLTEEELQHGRAIGPEQRMYYQTLLASAAEEKLAEEYDALNPLRFAQREAYLRGQIDILNMLLGANSVVRPKRYEPEEPNPTGVKS